MICSLRNCRKRPSFFRVKVLEWKNVRTIKWKGRNIEIYGPTRRTFFLSRIFILLSRTQFTINIRYIYGICEHTYRQQVKQTSYRTYIKRNIFRRIVVSENRCRLTWKWKTKMLKTFKFWIPCHMTYYYHRLCAVNEPELSALMVLKADTIVQSDAWWMFYTHSSRDH